MHYKLIVLIQNCMNLLKINRHYSIPLKKVAREYKLFICNFTNKIFTCTQKTISNFDFLQWIWLKKTSRMCHLFFCVSHNYWVLQKHRNLPTLKSLIKYTLKITPYFKWIIIYVNYFDSKHKSPSFIYPGNLFIYLGGGGFLL